MSGENNNKKGKNTLLFSVGPHQLYMQYILAKQLNIEKDILGVLRTDAPADGEKTDVNLMKVELFIQKKLKIQDSTKFESIYKIWGNSKIEKLISIPRLKTKLIEKLPSWINIDDIENVILTARYDLGEIILLSVFKNLNNVYFISDGNPYLYSKKCKYRIPFYLKLIGVKNPYLNNPAIYFSKNNLPDKFINIQPKQLDEDIYNLVVRNFEEDLMLKSWLKRQFGLVFLKKRSIIFLPPLERYPDLNSNIELYKKIIHSELSKVENNILLKHHPREKANILGVFKREILNEFGSGVFFYDDKHFLSRLPVELYWNLLNIDRVINTFSTSALFATGVKIVFYSSNRLLSKYVKTIEYLAGSFGEKVVYLN